MKIAWKAYYITCYLLSKFEGLHSMFAEQELFEYVYQFLEGKMEKKRLTEYTDMTFGLSARHLDKALKSFESDAEEYHQVMGK